MKDAKMTLAHNHGKYLYYSNSAWILKHYNHEATTNKHSCLKNLLQFLSVLTFAWMLHSSLAFALNAFI